MIEPLGQPWARRSDPETNQILVCEGCGEVGCCMVILEEECAKGNGHHSTCKGLIVKAWVSY